MSLRVYRQVGSLGEILSQQAIGGCCQVKMNGPPKTVAPASSGRKLTPLGKGGGAIEFEVFAAVEVTFLVEVIED